MHSAVERILAGEFNKGIHSLDFSSPRIELSVQEGEIYEGAFQICGPEGRFTEGKVFSSRLRMKCLVQSFTGTREEVTYRFDASGMEEGESVKGEFHIISNQGEYTIPYEVTIVAAEVDSSLGSVRNIFHFANLAKTNWEEAVNLFYSPEFKQIFKGVDRQYYAIYRGLSGGEPRQQNVEEFLLSVKKKQQVEFLTEETEIRIDAPGENVEYKVIINRNGWGFSELFVETEGDFLILEKEIIRDEDFLGNCYRLPFYIAHDKLHAGRNYGVIRLYNAYTDLTVTVYVHEANTVTRFKGIRTKKKHLTVELMQYYEAFRTRKISASLWMQETDKRLQELVEMDDRDPAYRLMQVQLLITQERFNEANWLLEQVDGMLQGNFVPSLYGYYLYLTTLINREEDYIDEVAGQIERIYTQYSQDWRIAWLLIYLSEDYNKSPSRKWIVLEEQIRKGCKSPVLYIEAWNLIAANPALLSQLEEVELQVLFYAAKKELLTPESIGQIVYLSARQKNYSDRLFHLLEKCYELQQTDEVLQAVCMLLIKGNKAETRFFPWYALGVEKELRITRLYEYYMMSCSLTEHTEIPKIVLMYFAFDSNLDSLHNAFLYAYVHQNREEYPELYENYREQIERFTVFQILKGRNNKWLSYLYKNIVTPVMITEETARGLATVLFVHRISIRRKDICRVILIYEKCDKERIFDVAPGEVYLPIYSSDYQIILEDMRGNRYWGDRECETERLIIPDKFALMAAPFVTGEIDFDMWLCERGKSLAAINDENMQSMKRLALSDMLVPSLQKEIRMRLIHFFYDNDRMQELDAFLEALLPEQINNRSYAEVVRFMVIRSMYTKAYEWIRQRGGQGIEPKVIMRLCSRMIGLEEAEQDDTMTALIYMTFQAGKYDENLLKYLVSYYHGTIKSMRDVWKAAFAFGIDTYEISERILVQKLYSGAYAGESIQVFKSYISGGAKAEIEIAFLSQSCFDYFVGEKVTDEFIMQDMQRVIERKEEIPLVCKLAYTKFYAEHKKLIDEKVSRHLVLFLRELISLRLYFPYYKEYVEHIPFMRQFADKTMIQYRAEEGSKAIIHYLMEKDGGVDGAYTEEEMPDMFGGICVKEFILFFGEKLQYYITETDGQKEHLTQSGTLNRSDTDREQRESRYNLINDIAIGRALHDNDAVDGFLREYYEQAFIVKELFKVI